MKKTYTFLILGLLALLAIAAGVNRYNGLFLGNLLGNPVLPTTNMTVYIGTNNGTGYFIRDTSFDANGNIGIGWDALSINADGIGHVAVGNGAMRSLQASTGNYNTGIGVNALTLLTKGTGNTAIGAGAAQSLINIAGNEVSYNTAVGYLSMNNNTNGDRNTAIGSASLRNCTTGSTNIAVGRGSAWNLVTGSFNIDIGEDITGAGITGDETGVIRIGTPGIHNNSYMAGNFHADCHGVTNVMHVTPSAATSGTVTAATTYQCETTYLSNSGTITSITFALPTTTVVGQMFYLHSKSIVTTLTVTGGSFVDAAVVALTAGQTIAYQATDTGGTYIRIE